MTEAHVKAVLGEPEDLTEEILPPRRKVLSWSNEGYALDVGFRNGMVTNVVRLPNGPQTVWDRLRQLLSW